MTKPVNHVTPVNQTLLLKAVMSVGSTFGKEAGSESEWKKCGLHSLL